MMKYIIVAALLAITQLSYAHEWPADHWAENQLQLTGEIMVCVVKLAESEDEFWKACSPGELVLRSMHLTNELITALKQHPQNSTFEDFVNSDFDDTKAGFAADRARKVALRGIMYFDERLLDKSSRPEPPKFDVPPSNEISM